MKKMNWKRGFTLIELLVVVAIIGILASVVLASLNSARTRGTDAAIKAAMSNARGQAELFYDIGQTYAALCTAAGGINPMLLNAGQKLNSAFTTANTTATVAYLYSATAAASTAVTCHENGTSWAAIASLKSPVGLTGGWCVDSTGASKESLSLGASIFACP